MFPPFTMQELICALVVAQEGNIARAAKKLHIDPSSVTRRIKHLEEVLGIQLFVRFADGVELTEAGELFIQGIMKVFEESNRASQLALQRAKHKIGPFHVGYSSHIHPELLPIVRGLRFRQPSYPLIEMESSTTHDIVQAVLDGRLQAGIGILPLRQPELVIREIYDEPFTVCMPKHHRLAEMASVPPEELGKESLIVIGRQVLPEVFHELKRHFRALGIRVHIPVETAFPAEAMHLTALGAGIALLSAGCSTLSRPGVVFRPLADKLLTWKTGVFVRRDNCTDLVNSFLEIIWKDTAQLRFRQRRRGPPEVPV